MIQEELIKLFEKSFPFWNNLSDDDKAILINSSHDVKFGKGYNIHDGNECTGIILVKSGSLRLYILSEDGKEITLSRLFAGDMCIISAGCVFNSLTFDVFVDSEENSECVILAGCAFEDVSYRLPEVKIFALEAALSLFSNVMWVMQQILFVRMDKRLALFLLEEAQKNDSENIKLTHEQIAKYVGSAREVISRMLKYFVSENIISASRADGIRIIDKERLRELTR